MGAYTQARSAYETARAEASSALGMGTEPADLTGNGDMTGWAMRLAKNPTKKTATLFYEAMLDMAETNGWDDGNGGAWSPPPTDTGKDE